MTEATETEEAAPATYPVDDLTQFVGLLVQWHTRRVAQLEHMLTIPEGTEVEVGGEQTLILTGEARRGFTLGITTALASLGKLPFVAEFEPQPALPVPTAEPA